MKGGFQTRPYMSSVGTMRTPFTALDRRELLAFAATHRAVLLLLVLALATRLPLMSISLDEGDAANFVNACWQSAQVGRIRTREDHYYEEPVLSSLRVLL